MTKLNASAFVFAIALTVSGTPLFGQSGTRTAPVAPSIDGVSVLQSDVTAGLSESVAGDFSSDMEPLSVGEEIVGEDYFDEGEGKVVGLGASVDRNRVFGISALSMSRENFNDAQVFDPGLSSGDVTLDRGGLELFMTTRNSQGRGWEVRYFGLFEDSDTVSQTLFPSGATGSLTRTGDVHNVELNFLRQAHGPLARLGLSLNEVIFGLRYFQVNDALRFDSNFSSGFGQAAENSLFGVQVGRRLEKQFGHRWGIAGFGKIGLYNNRLNSSLAFDGGSAFSGRKDDVAFLGEFDLALTYTFKPNVRAKLGYRTLGVTGIGIAERQSSGGFSPSQATDTNGDVSLQGGYIGIEFVR